MFSLFHKPASAQATLASDEPAGEASNASRSSEQACAGISPQAEKSMPEESAAGEAGQEETRSAGEGQEGFLVETALAKSLLPDRPSGSRTPMGNEGGKTAEASLSSPAPVARWDQTPDEEPAVWQVSEGRTTPTRELSDEEDCPEDSPPEDDALGIGARLPRPRGPRRSPRGRELRLPEEGQRQTFTPQQRLLVLASSSRGRPV